MKSIQPNNGATARVRNGVLTLLVILLMWLATESARAGNWIPLSTNAPDGVQLMMLLTDGTVACYDGSWSTNGGGWSLLTPDSSGSYTNGTFTTLKSMSFTRRFGSSQVLRDGRIFMAGAEYGTGWGNGEVYNPQTDNWTTTTPVGLLKINNVPKSNGQNTAGFTDSISMLLPDGRVLIAPNFPITPRGTVIYDPTDNTWSAGPATARSQNEVSWVKLPDDSILTVDVNTNLAERYIPSLNTWISDAPAPVMLYGNSSGRGSESGPGLLLPDGRAFFIGGTGKTAFYTPSGNTNNGSWSVGPILPNSQSCPDAPGAVMVNGKILFTCSPLGSGTNVFTTPTSYYEYDPVANTFARQNAPYPGGGLTSNRKCYTTCLLNLPDGNILYSDQSSQLYVYQPTGDALAVAKPTITSVIWHGGGRMRLYGTKLNGLNAGAAYGDNLQMDSNYPLVRFGGGGNVYFGRTYNRSSTGVATGNKVLFTDFLLPPSVYHSRGTYSMVTVANGVPSSSITFHGPVWVDFAYNGLPFEFGTYSLPYNTLAEGVSAVDSGNTIVIKAGHRNEPILITKAMTLVAHGGSVVIGQ